MLLEDTKGIWVRENRTWYYLETGPYQNIGGLTRLKNALVAKGFKMFELQAMQSGQAPYIIMSHSEAKRGGYDVAAIYLNSHVKEICENKKVEDAGNPWSS